MVADGDKQTVDVKFGGAVGFDVFDDVAYADAKLYVPEGCSDNYEADPTWGRFVRIEEIVGTGIGDAASGCEEVSITVADGSIVVSGASGVEVYSLDGTQVYNGAAGTVSGLPSGVYVVKAGGKTAKVALQ